MKVDDFGAWQAFHGVAVHKSFSKAARALKVSVPQLSKRVSRLESDLGTRLFARSTRVVNLTAEGAALFPKVGSLLDELASLESTFEGTRALSGTIRIACVPFVARRILIPVLAKFSQRHPDVRFELELSEAFTNLLESNIDLALRIHAEPGDTSLVYRKLLPNELVLCASPKYLERTKTPLRKPADLSRHSLLVLDIHKKCRFLGSTHRVGDFTGLSPFHCDNGWFLTELALEGAGVLLRSRLDVKEDLKRGTLVQVLKDFPIEPFGYLYAVVPSRKLLTPRVRALLDALDEVRK